MSSEADHLTPAPRHRTAIELPNPLWTGVVAAFLIVVAVGMCIGLPIYRQQIAIRAVEQAHGFVATEEVGPDFLRQSVGDERMHALDRVVGVDLHGRSPRHLPAALQSLRDLPHVNSLTLMYTSVTDAGLSNVKGLTELTDLSLEHTEVSDAGLGHLRGLTNLTHLDLSHTRVTNDGMRFLQRMDRLESLDLYGTEVNGSGLQYLAGLTKIKFLWVGGGGRNLTDGDLDSVRRFSRLEKLWLDASEISDEALAELKRFLPALEIHTVQSRLP